MSKRLELHEELVGILGSRSVYFQPPETVKMTYPCIVYGRSLSATLHADNRPYISKQGYSVKLIDKNPDSPIFDKLKSMSGIRFDRHYNADNLNHDVFTLYY